MNHSYSINNWEKIHSTREWGRYPSEDLIRFIARNYYSGQRNRINMLEIGCGQGANIWYIAREGFNAYGVDIAPSAIEKAKKYLEKDNLVSNFEIGDIQELKYDSNFFNCIIDIQCLQCNMIKGIKDILKESYRLLKDGGKIFSMCFSTDTHGFGTGEEIEHNTFKNIDKSILTSDLHHFFTKDELLELYTEVGFKKIEINSNIHTYENDTLQSKTWIVEATK